MEKPDYRHSPLLRVRGERPSNYRTDSSFDEIAASHCQPRNSALRQRGDYNRDLRPAKWGTEISLQGSNPEQADMCDDALAYVCFGPEGDITKKEVATVGTPKLISSHPFYMRRD
jgi:hypothetical protein